MVSDELISKIIDVKAKIAEELVFTPIPSINIEHINKLVKVKGTLKANSQIVPKVLFTSYRCMGCNSEYDEKPRSCDCGNRRFEKISEHKNLIKAIFQEETKEVKLDRNYKNSILEVHFSEDCTNIINYLSYGETYEMVGKISVENKKKDDETFILDCKDLKKIATGIESIKLDEEDIIKIKEIGSDPDRKKILINAVFGDSIIDLDIVLEACILQMVSAPKEFDKILKDRGNIMIVLAGSPGTGKSIILRMVNGFFPRSVYAPCTSTSAIGLIAAVEKDERIGDWAVYPGAIPLSHPNGISVVDEMDKINKDDMSKLNTLMDTLRVDIHKASIHQTILADVSLLCAMNPMYRKFEKESDKSFIDQLNVPKDFLDRFDLVFNLDSFKNKDHEERVLDSTYKLVEKEEIGSISKEIAIKYIAYARNIVPIVTTPARQEMKEVFKNIIGTRVSSDEAYYSKRINSILYRLSRAYARLRLSDEVTSVDIFSARDLILSAFKSMGLVNTIKGQQTINEEKVESMTPKSDIKVSESIIRIIKDFKGNPVHINEIYARLDKVDPREVDKMLDKLRRNGDIYEPINKQFKLM